MMLGETLAFFYVLWVCVPMLPAILIYMLFPKQRIGVQGPLGGLTISATGAFAAYVIVFALAYPIVNKFQETIGGMSRPAWQVSAKIQLIDDTGKPIDSSWLDGLVVELRPQTYSSAKEYVRVLVPEVGGSLPDIVLRIPGFGSGAINMSDVKLKKDEYRKTVSVPDAVIIRRFPTSSAGMTASVEK